jgi:predicted Zn-dependent peptidase
LSETISSRQKVIVISGSLPANIDTYLKDLKVMNYNPNKKMGESISDNFKKPNLFDTDKSIVITPQNTKQVVIILGSTTIPHSHPDDIALRILSCHLGSGMSSVLFNILREEKGLTYDVGIYYPVRELNAPFIIHASSSKDKAMETLILIKKCWNNLQYSLLSNEELDLAKSKFRYNFAHNSQTISQRAERKAHLIGLNIDENYDLQILNLIDSITKEDIIRVSSLYLKWPVLSLCGPEDKLNQLRDFWIESSN